MSDGEVTRLKILTVNLIPGHLRYHGGAASEKVGRNATNGQVVAAGPARAGPLAEDEKASLTAAGTLGWLSEAYF